MNLEQLLRLSIAQVEAKKALKKTGRYGRYLKRCALRKLGGNMSGNLALAEHTVEKFLFDLYSAVKIDDDWYNRREQIYSAWRTVLAETQSRQDENNRLKSKINQIKTVAEL
jgi:hypothetical protein